MKRVLIALVCALATARCGPTGPVDVALGQDACAQCRMSIVSLDTASQIIAPGAEPIVFDDLGCLRDYLKTHQSPPGAAIYVWEHRSRDWIDAEKAVFTRTGLATPMGSGLMAHADAASRDADPAARSGEAVAARDILRPTLERLTP